MVGNNNGRLTNAIGESLSPAAIKLTVPVPDLEAFLRAALMLPRSLTADFNFPAWQYYVRGSGEERVDHHYELRPVDIRRQEVDS